MKQTLKATKHLSSNDIGKTGSHQAGIHIPKDSRILRLFPKLDENIYNPDQMISVEIPQLSAVHNFRFIYYNNRRFSSGTRDEYRLTRMTGTLRDLKAEEGDFLEFSTGTSTNLIMQLRRKAEKLPEPSSKEEEIPVDKSPRWTVTVRDF